MTKNKLRKKFKENIKESWLDEKGNVNILYVVYLENIILKCSNWYKSFNSMSEIEFEINDLEVSNEQRKIKRKV
jgi:hypothetical protein